MADIDKLTEDLKPVERLPGVWFQVVQLMVALGLCAGAGLSFIGLRHDISARLSSDMEMFLLENVLMAIAGISAALAAFRLSVPTLRVGISTAVLVVLPVVVWGGLIAVSAMEITPTAIYHELTHGPHCFVDVLVIGVLPGIFLFFMLRRAAPVHFGLVGFLGVLAVASFGAIASRYMCSMEDMTHLFVWHFLPVLLIGFVGIALGRFCLKW